MATAFNPSSTIANVSVEAPDFSMLTKAAASVQGRYLEGFNKYKSTLTSLLNANITSDSNKQFRSEYFKKIDEYLTNLRGIDFSNPANVSVASALMQPLVKDKEFVTDLNFSAMQSAERSKLEQVRMSTDQKVYSQYSPTMEAAMSYAEMDMKNAKRGDGSIYKANVQKFVPFADIQNDLNEAAAKQKLEIKIDRLTGAYIVTDTNGQQAIPNFTQWARQQLGDKYDEQLLVTGKVQVRREIDALMQSDPNMTKEKAYQEVAKNHSINIYQNTQDYKQGLNDGISNIDIELKKIKNKYNSYIPKGSQDEQLYNQLTQLKTEYKKELSDLVSNQSGKEEELQTAFKQFMNNPEYSLLSPMKDNLSKGWAQTYAMNNVGHEIKVNQKVLQDQAHAWQRYMADYNFGLDMRKKKLDYDLQLAKEDRDWETFKKQKDYEAGIARDKSIFDAQLDFEKSLLGLGGKGKGKGGAGNPNQGKLTPGPSQFVDTESDIQTMFQTEKQELMEKVLDGYLNETVLKAATHDSRDYIHPDVTNALTNVMQNFGTYGNPNSKNFANAPKEYKENYAQAIKFLKLINGNINIINQTADIPTAIFNGVRSYTGNALVYKDANNLISSGAKAFNDYISLRNQELTGIKNAMKDGYGNVKFWKTLDNGKVVPNPDLNDEDKIALYKRITPNYDAYKAKTLQRKNSVNFSGDPKNFDYTAIGELIKKASKIEGVKDGTLVRTKDKDNPLDVFIKEYGNLGSKLGQYFKPDFNVVPLADGGLRVEIPLASGKKSEENPLSNGSSKSAVFYIDKANAMDLWQSKSKTSFLGKDYVYNNYGELANVYSYFSNKIEPAKWVIDGFNSNQSKVHIPEYLKIFGIQDGYITFDKVKDELYAVIQSRNKTQSYSTGIKQADLIKDPDGVSRTINDVVEAALAKVQKANWSEMQQEQALHNNNVLQNKNNFTKVSD